jgi:hypothetical protein
MSRDTRFELRCSSDEVEGWKSAAGFEPVSSWCRRMLNEAAGAVDVASAHRGYLAAMENFAVTEPEVIEARQRVEERGSFRPDFKGGKR